MGHRMDIAEIKRELEFAKSRGGDQAKIAQIGLRLCARVTQLEKEKAERSQLTLFGDVTVRKTPIGT